MFPLPAQAYYKSNELIAAPRRDLIVWLSQSDATRNQARGVRNEKEIHQSLACFAQLNAHLGLKVKVLSQRPSKKKDTGK